MILLKVLDDLWEHEKLNSRNRTPWAFLVNMILTPVLVTSVLMYFDVDIVSERANTLINAIAIFLGFLIASLIPFFEIAVDLFRAKSNISNSTPQVPKADEKEVDLDRDKNNLLKIILSCILAAIMVSLICLIALIIKSMMPPLHPMPFLCSIYSFFYDLMNVLIFLSATSLVMIIFNIIKRTRAFIKGTFQT